MLILDPWSSFILKVFEKVILILWGHLLPSGSLQFGVKAKTSTIQCTWMVMVTEVVQNWTRHPRYTVLGTQLTILPVTSARTDILGRYGKFCRGLRTSVSQEIRVLFNFVARGLQCITAKNIKLVGEQLGWILGQLGLSS